MKFFALFSSLLAVGLAEVIAAPYGSYGYPYAGYGYGGAAYTGYPYAAHPYAAHPYAAHPYAAVQNTGSQFHAQDEFGNLNYGYSNLNSAKQEVGNTYGGVTGGYSYVDANNILQTVQYIADGAGFRTVDSRLPVAPTFDAELPVAPVYHGVAPTFNPEPLVAPVYTGVAPEAPLDTPEVAAARAEHLAAHAALKTKRSADPAVIAGSTQVLSLHTPLIHNAPVRPVIPALGLGYPGLGYAGLGYSGLGYSGLGYTGLGHAGLGYPYAAAYGGAYHYGTPALTTALVA